MVRSRGPTRQDASARSELAVGEIALSAEKIRKSFGSTKAVREVSVVVRSAEALGIVGHNGAGKTTLMKVLAGLMLADDGIIKLGPAEMPRGFTVMDARAAGLRLASQEITLCPDLRVFENVVLAHPALASRGWGWRAEAKAQFKSRLNDMFPGIAISPQAVVGRLSLSERQIVQLTIALLPGVSPIRCVVLDEPTSALAEGVADHLFRYLRKLRSETGAAVVIISHKMRDIVRNADRVIVMKDGAIVKEFAAQGLRVEEVIEAMGGGTDSPGGGVDGGGSVVAGRPLLIGTGAHREGRWSEERPIRVTGPDFAVYAGEVVGLAGLEGQGQTGALQAIWSASRYKLRGHLPGKRWKLWQVAVGTRVAYVSGDRQQFGVFPLWNVRENLSVGALRKLRRAGMLSRTKEKGLIDKWMREMDIRAAADQWIMELSGGNQQKVLLARGLATGPDVILLDDPFRGVDIMTRRSSYRWLHDEAARGTSIVWYSSEGEEMRQCDRVYVFNGGDVVAELADGEISEEQIIKHSFTEAREIAN